MDGKVRKQIFHKEEEKLNRRKIILACDFDYKTAPLSDTILGFSKICTILGYGCAIVGFHEKKKTSIYQKENVEYYHIGCCNELVRNPVLRRINRNTRMRAFVREHEELFHADFVIYFGANCEVLYREILKRKNARIIIYTCEWWDIKRLYKGISSVADWCRATDSLVKDIYSREIGFVKNGNVIAISNTLLVHYKLRGCRGIKIPVMIGIPDLRLIERQDEQKLLVAYFGSPGIHNSKDRLDKIIAGIASLEDEEKKNVEFHIYGVEDEDELSKMCDISTEVMKQNKTTIFLHGRISKENVRECIIQYDFTLLLRDDTYSMNCGLSSKMVESMAYGVPLICNLTSDMGEYVIDGKSGIICDECSPEAMADAIKRALRLKRENILEMKRQVRQIAKENFSWEANVKSFEKILNQVMLKQQKRKDFD